MVRWGFCGDLRWNMKNGIAILRMTGRCANGAERDGAPATTPFLIGGLYAERSQGGFPTGPAIPAKQLHALGVLIG